MMHNQKVQNAIWLIVILLCMAAVCVAHVNTLTYVSGQDPFMYLRLANRMAVADSADEVIQQLTQAPFLPAYPAILALSIKAFGPFAPFWVNVLLFLCMIPILAFLLRYLLQDIWAGILALLAVLWVVFNGYPLNAHFLLYPFRGLPAMFFMITGLALFYSGADQDRRRFWLLAGSGCCFIFAILMREPSVFAMVGPLGWLLFGYKGTPKEKFRRGWWFAIPWMVGLLGWLCLGLVSGRLVSPQFSSWSRIIFSLGPTHLIRQFGGNAQTMLGFFPAEFGWIALVLLILGIWKERRNTRLLSAFLVPTLLFFLFYAVYESHRRYFLNALIFSAVFVGPGIMLVVDGIRKMVPRVLRIWLPVLPVAILAVWLGVSVAGLTPWGPDVSIEQARQVRETLNDVSRPGDYIFIDPRCRYMVDAVVSLTDLKVAHPRAVQRLLNEKHHCLFADPLNEACYYKGDSLRKYTGVSGVPLLKHFAELRPYKTKEGNVRIIEIGKARFGVYNVSPWTTRRTLSELSCPSGSNRVLWLDFGNLEAACLRKIRLLDSTFKVSYVWDDITTGGIHAFLLPESATDSPIAHVEVMSDCTIPSGVVLGCISDGEFMEWPLGVQRSVSVQSWFREPFIYTDTDSKYAAVFNKGGAVHLPVIHSKEPYRMKVRLIKSPDKPMKKNVQIQYEHAGNILVDKKISLSKSRIWSLLQLPASEQEEQAIMISVHPADAHGNYLRIEELAIAIEKAE